MTLFPQAPGPIGVFDSGYGGLSVFDKIHQLMPEYDYLYLGDNARTPYGPRSFEVVYQFTRQAVSRLPFGDSRLQYRLGQGASHHPAEEFAGMGRFSACLRRDPADRRVDGFHQPDEACGRFGHGGNDRLQLLCPRDREDVSPYPCGGRGLSDVGAFGRV